MLPKTNTCSAAAFASSINMLKRTCGLALAAWCVAACSPAGESASNASGARQPPPVVDPAARLSERDLAQLMAGGTVIAAYPPISDATRTYAELFHADGRYDACTEFSGPTARYAVRGDSLCVTFGQETRCRQLFHGPAGTYVQLYIQRPNDSVPVATLVTVRSLHKGMGCRDVAR